MKKVLIVEDDLDIGKALKIRLEASGYEVCVAQDGYMGLRAAIIEQPDIMILDISMPAGDGFSVVERMRGEAGLPNIPFVILTASKLPEFRETAKAMGAAAYFEKPFESAAIIKTIDEVVSGGWKLQI